jgi:6-phosphogluconate dehydrogenase
MSQSMYDFGMVGLGVMGRNFLHNVADHGFSALGLDLDQEKVNALSKEASGRDIAGTTSMKDFVTQLKAPRKIMLLVPAGKAVDAVIGQLLDYVEKGDLIIDGGNSHFEDTNRRMGELSEKGIHFLGVGVSGGAEGARRGPSIMPGGDRNAYQMVAPILEAVAAKVNGEPCVDYMGAGSAGHYVKMVHNGIEYGLMQLIAEVYDILKRIAKLPNDQISDIFAEWNQKELRSFLIEITAAIFSQSDEEGDGDLIDKILDKAKQKGTGKWTSQSALDLGIPIPTIDSAVSMRGLSAQKVIRLKAAETFPDDHFELAGIDTNVLVKQLRETLYFSFVVTYAQGYTQLAEASEEFDYGLNLERIAKIWRGGCIIRADLLEDIRLAFQEEEQVPNLLLADAFQAEIFRTHNSVRQILKLSLDYGIPTMCLSSALNYYDSLRTGRLPLNLVQAQRDYFGSHTYERIDKGGVFHTEWEK